MSRRCRCASPYTTRCVMVAAPDGASAFSTLVPEQADNSLNKTSPRESGKRTSPSQDTLGEAECAMQADALGSDDTKTRAGAVGHRLMFDTSVDLHQVARTVMADLV